MVEKKNIIAMHVPGSLVNLVGRQPASNELLPCRHAKQERRVKDDV